jgi:two-component system OmpR family response regulator
MHIKKVLLVDDDPNIRKLARMSLERVGKWEVVVAESGSEAIDLFSKVQPDVVVLDVMMPGLDGRTTLTRLKEKSAELPVILMTAKVQAEEIVEYLSLGAIGVIMKPFDPMSLPKEISDLLEKNDKN